MARVIALVAVVLALCAVAAVEARFELRGRNGVKLVQPTIDASLLAAVSDVTAEVSQGGQAASTGCSQEPLKRIALCTKILRTFLSPNPDPNKPQHVPFAAHWSSSQICKDLNKLHPATVNYDNCQAVAGHVFGAAGSTAQAVVDASRLNDIHDVCVTFLSHHFPANSGQQLITLADASVCSLKATGGVTGTRVLMFHGMGVSRLTYAGDAITTTTYSRSNDGWLGYFPKYWSVHDQMDSIADVRYYVTDTNTRGWHLTDLQKEYCAAIEKWNPHIIFTHSMANNIIAAGIKGGFAGCSRISQTPGANRIAWYSSQAPWLGSPAASSAHNACYKRQTSVGAKLRDMILRAVNPCDKELAAVSMAQEFQNPSNSQGTINLKDMKAVAAAYTSGALCGISGTPLAAKQYFTQNGIGLWALAKLGNKAGLVDWGVDAKTKETSPFTGNDGLVPFASCHIDGKAYAGTPDSPYYVVLASHEDSCMIPDIASNGALKQPCSWMVRRVMATQRSLGLAPDPTRVGAVSKTGAYQPFGSFSYPKSFLQLENYMTFEEVTEMERLAEEAKRPTAHTQVQAEAAEAPVAKLHSVKVAPVAISHLESAAHSTVNVDAMLDAQVESEAQESLEAEGLIDAEADTAADAEFEADAEIGAEVEMETAHEQLAEQANEHEALELEAMLDSQE